MPIGFQKPKTKSGSAGPGGKNPGTSCHGKTLFPSLLQPSPRIHLQDPLTGRLQKILEFWVVQDRLAAVLSRWRVDGVLRARIRGIFHP